MKNDKTTIKILEKKLYMKSQEQNLLLKLLSKISFSSK